MAILPIRTFGDPVLREPALRVERFDDALRTLARDMIDTMHDAPGVGLAAPQVGRGIRLIVFDVGEGPGALVNPTLSDFEGEQMGEEGCLSLPGLYFPVRRAMRVTASGFDVEGNPVTIEAEELLARVFQHEVDRRGRAEARAGAPPRAGAGTAAGLLRPEPRALARRPGARHVPRERPLVRPVPRGARGLLARGGGRRDA
jgi:peptide deformylase